MAEFVHWNPNVRPGRRPWRWLRRRRTVNNFGDLLGPMVSAAIVEERLGVRGPQPSRRLLSVGSILHLARPGDVIWGTGVNGKKLDTHYPRTGLDIRAVRGPRTASFLRALGWDVPAVYGDPALLAPRFWPADPARRSSRPLFVPNLHDADTMLVDGRFDVLSPHSPPHECLAAIAAAPFVVATSLHGGVIADAYGVGARFVQSATEPPFKYLDYLEGTGRPAQTIASSVAQALEIGPHAPLAWSPEPLLDAFPMDLFQIG